MVVSCFTMTLGYPGAARALILIVLSFGALEYFWIQVVYNRFPILHQDQVPNFASKSQIMTGDETDPAGESQIRSGWRDEITIWREFVKMPIIFSKPNMV